jgi:hypothetical protein
MRILIAILALSIAACGAATAQVSVKTDGNRTTATVPEPAPQVPGTYVVVPGSHAPIALGRLSLAAAGPLNIPAEFTDQGDVLVHTATGVRLPMVHEGCKLVALEPSSDHDGAPPSFAAGALAEYDCRPSEALTYVQVRFQGSALYLKDRDLAQALPEVANSVVQLDARVPNDQCANMQLPPQSPFSGFSVAQCGARWSSPGDPQAHVYGTAAMAFGRGTSVVLFSNTCLDGQCDANRAAFGKFILSFDISGLHDIIPAGR